MKVSKFLSRKQQQAIVEAIQLAEDKTSGEIKLHIENRCESELLDRTKEVFYMLQMHETELKNGVLIYIAINDKKVSIIGDKGIDAVTPENYWEQEVNALIESFKQGHFSEGIISTIGHIAEKLQDQFPIQLNDINELSDEISFFDN